MKKSMDISYAILGLLSRQPYSGYDLKKIISESDLYYWSGNNNQIYTALIALHKAGLVSQEVQLQASLPARKLYSITAAGQEALHQWLRSEVELPELRNSFLIRLAGAGDLSNAELDDLLARYEQDLDVQLRMRRQAGSPALPHGTSRQAYLEQQIGRNLDAVYENELAWVRQVRQDLNAKKYEEV